MNEIINTIKKRRSIRSFEDKPIEKEKIEQILEAGMWGPSAMNKQLWHFIIVQNKDVMKKITEMRLKADTDPNSWIKRRLQTTKDPILYHAPLYIVITGQKDFKWTIEDGMIAAQNIILAAESLGLGSCYIGTVKIFEDDPKFRKILKIPENHKFVMSMVIGYPKEEAQPKERNKDVVTFID